MVCIRHEDNQGSEKGLLATMSRVGREVKRQGTQEMVLDPQRRVKKLAEAGSSVNVNKTFAVKRYFRSGSEMERQVS